MKCPLGNRKVRNAYLVLKNKYLSLDRRQLEVNTKWAKEIQCDSNHPDCGS